VAFADAEKLKIRKAAAMPTASMNKKEELKALLAKYAHRRSETPIQLSSGAWTQEYFDGKQITLFPDRAVLLARVILENMDLTGIEAVGGMSIGADPIVSAISLVAYLDKGLKIPAFLVRKEAKKHGLQKMIEGIEITPGMKTLIVDDVITQGTATLKAIEAAEAAGAKVVAVACLVDREEGGSKAISAKYEFYSVFKKSEL